MVDKTCMRNVKRQGQSLSCLAKFKVRRTRQTDALMILVIQNGYSNRSLGLFVRLHVLPGQDDNSKSQYKAWEYKNILGTRLAKSSLSQNELAVSQKCEYTRDKDKHYFFNFVPRAFLNRSKMVLARIESIYHS